MLERMQVSGTWRRRLPSWGRRRRRGRDDEQRRRGGEIGGGGGGGGEDRRAAVGSAVSMLRMDLDLMMSKILTFRERRCIALRYGLDDGQHRSVREVASILGINRNGAVHLLVRLHKMGIMKARENGLNA